MGEPTPGPWTVQADGLDMQEVYGPAIRAGSARSFDGSTLAAAFTIDDARLIAAAPDLLAALEEIEVHPSSDAVVEQIRRVARVAIAKAKGSENAAP